MEWDAGDAIWSCNELTTQSYSLLMQGWSTPIAEEPLVIAITALDSQDPISSRTVEARQFRQENFALEVTTGGFPQTNPSYKHSEIESVGIFTGMLT